MYTFDTKTNWQGTPTKINKNGAIAKVSGASDNIRHLKTFRIFSNKMLVLLLILCWWFFSCLHMYWEKFYNNYYHEQIFFKIFVVKGDTGQFFLRNNSLWTVQFS